MANGAIATLGSEAMLSVVLSQTNLRGSRLSAMTPFFQHVPNATSGTKLRLLEYIYPEPLY